jgi:predicted transcriptional regulator
MKYRSKNGIFASILNSATGDDGIRITRIMYNSFLSYSQVTYYLRLLRENGTLYYDEMSRVYKTTDRGLKFLELYNGMGELLKVKLTIDG